MGLGVNDGQGRRRREGEEGGKVRMGMGMGMRVVSRVIYDREEWITVKVQYWDRLSQ